MHKVKVKVIRHAVQTLGLRVETDEHMDGDDCIRPTSRAVAVVD